MLVLPASAEPHHHLHKVVNKFLLSPTSHRLKGLLRSRLWETSLGVRVSGSWHPAGHWTARAAAGQRAGGCTGQAAAVPHWVQCAGTGSRRPRWVHVAGGRMGRTRQHPDQHQPPAPQCPWPTPGLPRLPGAPRLEPKATLLSPRLPLQPPALGDSGAAGSFSSPRPHFPIQDIWVSSTRRRLICPLIPQAGGARPHGDLSCCGAPGLGAGALHVPGLPRQVSASLGCATTR